MAQGTTFVGRTPDGREFHRTSTTRQYTHAVLIYNISHGDTQPSWGPVGFCGRPDLARKLAKSWVPRVGGEHVTVVPVRPR